MLLTSFSNAGGYDEVYNHGSFYVYSTVEKIIDLENDFYINQFYFRGKGSARFTFLDKEMNTLYSLNINDATLSDQYDRYVKKSKVRYVKIKSLVTNTVVSSFIAYGYVEDTQPPNYVTDNLSDALLIDEDIEISFDEKIIANMLNFELTNSANEIVPLTAVSVDNSNKSKVILYHDSLNYGTDYNLKISNVSDLYGNLMVEDVNLSFVTMDIVDKPMVSATPTVKKIQLNWNSVEGAEEYNIYINGSLINSLGTTEYLINGLNHDTNYEIKVEVTGANIYSNYSVLNVRTLDYFTTKPIKDGVDVDYYSATVKWNDIENTKYFEVKLGDGSVIQVNGTEYTFEGLNHSTDYIAYIRQINLVDEASEWTSIGFTTLPPPEVPPPKPTKLTVLEVDENNVTVEVSETTFANTYSFYLNNVKVGEQAKTTYTYTGLEENTTYNVYVKAKNEFGESFSTGLIVRTKKGPVPTVTSGSSSGNGSMTNRRVTWESENTSTVKIIVDGVKIGEYSADSEYIDIDFVELGLTEGMHDIEVVPVEEGGIAYKFKVNLDGTGDDDIDNIVSKVDEGTSTLKKAGLYVLLFLLNLLILFFSARWVFNKWKLSFLTKNESQLEADPDIAMGKGKNGLDREAYRAAKESENDYFDDKRDQRQEIKDKYEFDKAVGRYVDAETGEVMSENFKPKPKVNGKYENKKSFDVVKDNVKNGAIDFMKYALSDKKKHRKGGSYNRSYSNDRIKSLENTVQSQQETINQLLKKLK